MSIGLRPAAGWAHQFSRPSRFSRTVLAASGGLADQGQPPGGLRGGGLGLNDGPGPLWHVARVPGDRCRVDDHQPGGDDPGPPGQAGGRMPGPRGFAKRQHHLVGTRDGRDLVRYRGGDDGEAGGQGVVGGEDDELLDVTAAVQ